MKLFLLFATCIFLAIFGSTSFAEDSTWVPSGQTLTPAGAQILFARDAHFCWESRTSDNYSQDNLYYPTNYSNDSVYGVKKVGLKNNISAFNGLLSFGFKYCYQVAKLVAWDDDFYQFSNLFYSDAQYGMRLGSITPYVAGQFLREVSQYAF